MGVLTRRQADVLRMVGRYVQAYGYPPSYREIGEAVGLHSTGAVAHQVRRLVESGHLRQRRGIPRGLSLTIDGGPQ
ncbi:hypothetical protein Val02_68920 [Virgisporangium aliadipatigenens]|uniref:LexA repressor DNA-binding domain-containing protein n=1 Tax=Virgisporangium aliadipatigenens TaxID=741659 RepID=A0A8J4DU63_9ACTN|nr:hypothetical protein [Virgisporangium aliadipatigenens]GIJ50006.1 hypothetical protein Val02_68920 [Virgisporangium aliadipatigenens]